MRRFDVAWLRCPRLTILIVLTIYAGLLLVHYRGSWPLKIDDTTNSLPEERDGRVMEKIALEMDDEKQVDDEPDSRDEEESAVKREMRDDPRRFLEYYFRKADIDQSDFLDVKELSKYIHSRIMRHIERAVRDNVVKFTAIDSDPRNGEVSWDEYNAHILRSHGSQLNSRTGLQEERPLKEVIQRDRVRWSEAARNDPDKLNLDEFLAFTHPESSHRVLLQKVEELFEIFDQDGDEQLTEDEFAGYPSEGANIDPNQSIVGSQERRQEFRHLIDKDKNGKADRAEFLAHVDPRNPRHAILEAWHLFELADVDHDGKLKLSEILSKSELFLGSKMVDTESSFHDEFR